jgi:hypothetical protein
MKYSGVFSRSARKGEATSTCFLTTATVDALGLPDDCEPLELARFLRDEKMTSPTEQHAVELYYAVAPTIVERSEADAWTRFWDDHMSEITDLIRTGEYELAKDMYTVATADLIQRKATRYADVDNVDAVYDYGLKGVGRRWLPYPVRFAVLKVALSAWLPVQRLRLRARRARLTKAHA